MKLLVKGKNVDVSRRVQDYAEKRLAKLSLQLDDDLTSIELVITEEKNPRVADCHVVEAVISTKTKGRAMHAREASHDVYASIDMIADKLARQVKKYHDKRVEYRHGGAHGHEVKGSWKSAGAQELPAGFEFDTQTMGDDDMARTDSQLRIVKTKQFSLGPISPEEAAEHMALVGHEFFVFVNDESGETNVLYKRSDGQYGLIEPTVAEQAALAEKAS